MLGAGGGQNSRTQYIENLCSPLPYLPQAHYSYCLSFHFRPYKACLVLSFPASFLNLGNVPHKGQYHAQHQL